MFWSYMKLGEKIFYFIQWIYLCGPCACLQPDNEEYFGKRNHKSSSGENYIRFNLPVIVNNTERSVSDKISTQSYEGLAIFVKIITICNNKHKCN